MDGKLLTRLGVSYKAQQNILVIFASLAFFVAGYLWAKGIATDTSDWQRAVVPLLTGIIFLYSGLKNPPQK